MKPTRATKEQMDRVESVFNEVLVYSKDLSLKHMKSRIFHTIRKQDGLSIRNAIIKRHHVLFAIRHKTW